MARPKKQRWDFGAPDMEKLLGETKEYKGESLWQDAWRRLKRNRSAFWAMVFLALFAGTSIFAPLLPLASPTALSLRPEAMAPSWPWQSPPPTGEETPAGAAVTKSFGAVMDNGWRHRSTASFEVTGDAGDSAGDALVDLVEEVTGRGALVDQRSVPGDGGQSLYHISVPYDWDDPAHTDWEPTGLEAEGQLRLVGSTSAWLDVTLPDEAADPAQFDSWSVQTSDLNGSLTLRAAGDRLVRYAFRLEQPFLGSFDGLTVNGHWAPAIGKTADDGPLGRAPETTQPEGAGKQPAAENEQTAPPPATAAGRRAEFLEGLSTATLALLDEDDDQRIVAESRGKQKVLYDALELELVEERGIVHQDLERRLRTALATFVAPAGSTIELTEIGLEDGYGWDLYWFDYPLITLRAAIFGTWQTGNWMGTDSKGRDILARIVWGSRTSIIVALIATLCSLMIGVTYGAFSGLMGGRIDNLMMRFVDILYSLPFIFVVIFLITILNEYSVELKDRFGVEREHVFYLVIGAIYWLTMARVVRGQVLSLKNSEFIEASRVIGASTRRILFAHLVPNVLSIVIVYLTLTIPAVMLFEAFLTFLGLGIEPPKVSWGTLAVDSTEAVNPVKIYWWLVLFPAAAMGSTLLALNVLGDGLRDALDPKLRGKD